MARHYRWLAFIIALTAFAIWVSLPTTEGFRLRFDFNQDGEADFDFNFMVRQSLGLDLVGGLRVLLQAEEPPESIDDLRETANNVSRRVNGLGLTEATVQVQGSNRILVELPGVVEREQAINTIQATALLEFVNFSGLGFQADDLVGQRILTTEQQRILENRVANAATPEEAEEIRAAAPATVSPLTGLPFETVITGSGLQNAVAQLQPGSTAWVIQFDLTPEGSAIFGPFTGSNIGQPLAIVLDGEVLSAPTIEDALPDGGVITGDFAQQEAQQLALQLRSGALPIPLRVESSTAVGATLGQESVNLSIRAGIIGVIVVLLFMLIYYRVPGLAAALALLVFIVLNFAIFKIIPITLTLPAITGFLISIGTAVDGNILIFERVKEELRAGRKLEDALNAGFDRAWSSIRDSNFSTIIICGVLFLFGQTPGASIVSGFAVTLALGLVLNLFTAVIVTRTFLYLFAGGLRQPLTERKWLLGV